MFRTSQFIVAALLSAIFIQPANAGDIFGLLKCGACCGEDCDSGCCEIAACGAGCCDPGCSDSSCCESDCGLSCDRGTDSCCSQRPCCYTSLMGGWNALGDYTGENQTIGPPPSLRGTFSDGWAIAMAKGRHVNDTLRAEVELGFRSNTADTWSVNGAPGNLSGHLFAYSGMANLIKDLDACQFAGITPYVGAGLGLAIFQGDLLTPTTEIIVDDAAFAYQFMLGGSRQLRSNVDVFAEYRYFATTTVDVQNGPSGLVIDEHEPEYHNVFFGLRMYR